jgi:citronellol/citronellal dehydrogenase
MSGVLTADANRGKVALVTGGGTGIGRATAIALAGSGARVAICGRRPEPLREVRSELETGGAECLAVTCDVREPDQVRALVDATLERFGAVDVLVNNAGGQFTAPAEEITTKGMRAVHRLAIDAAWELTREVATRSMIPRAGGLVVFTGFSPRRGIPGFAHAAAARAALENLAQGLALEWSGHGVRSVCVVLGNIDTEGLAAYGPEAVEASRRQVPLGRLGTPEEVGETIAFLGSAGGAYITGSSVLVDGGLDAWGQGAPPPSPSEGSPGDPPEDRSLGGRGGLG